MLFAGFYMQRALKKGIAYVGKNGISKSLIKYLSLDNEYKRREKFKICSVNCYDGCDVFLIDFEENATNLDVLNRLRKTEEFSKIFKIHTIFYNKSQKQVKSILLQTDPILWHGGSNISLRKIDKLIDFLNMIKKLYENNLIFTKEDVFSYFNMIFETFISPKDKVTGIFEGICDLKEKDEKISLSDALRSIVICWCNTCNSCFSTIEDSKSAYDFSKWMCSKLFNALKSSDEVDFISLVYNLKNNLKTEFDGYEDVCYNRETYFDILPTKNSISINYTSPTIDADAEQENIDKLKLFSIIQDFEIVPTKLKKRKYNAQMQLIGIETKKISYSSGAERYNQECTIEMKLNFIKAFIELVNKIDFTQIAFTKQLSLKDDFVFFNSGSQWVCLIDNIDKLKISSELRGRWNCYFINILLESLKDEVEYTYDSDNKKIIYNNISVVNYLSSEFVVLFHAYLLHDENLYERYFLEIDKYLRPKAVREEMTMVPMLYQSETSEYINIPEKFEKDNVTYNLCTHDVCTDYFTYHWAFCGFSKHHTNYPAARKIIAMNAKYFVIDSNLAIVQVKSALPESVRNLEEIYNISNITEKEILKVIINIINSIVLYFINENKISFDINRDILVDDNFNFYYSGNVDHVEYDVKPLDFFTNIIEKYRAVRGCIGSRLDKENFSEFNINSKNFKWSKFSEYLNKEYEKLDSYCKHHNYWYNSKEDGLCKFCYPRSVTIDFLDERNKFHTDYLYDLYKYSEEKFAIIIKPDLVDTDYFQQSVIQSLADNEIQLLRDAHDYSVMGCLVPTVFYEKFYYTPITRSQLKKVEIDWLFDFILESFSLIENVKEKIRYTQVNNSWVANFFEDANILDKIFFVLTDHLGNKNTKNEIEVFYIGEFIRPISDYVEKDVITIMKDILKYIVEIKPNLSYLISSKKIDKMDSPDKIIKYITKLHKSKEICNIHNIWFSSHRYKVCPKCVTNADSVVLVDPSSYDEQEKTGGEALIYNYKEDNTKLLKLYRKGKDGKYLVNIQNKATIISSWIDIKQDVLNETFSKKFTLVLPEMIAVDKSKKEICGFIMPKIVDVKPISLLMDIEYAEVNNLSKLDILRILINLGEALRYLESKGWYIGDFNGGNILFSKENHNVYVIDTDSLGGVAENEPKVFVESYLDPLAMLGNEDAKMNIKTDHYTFALICFASLTGLHPFGGVYREDGKIINMIERMKRKVSVLGQHDIKIPKSIFPWNWMSSELKNAFLSIFEGNARDNILEVLKREYESVLTLEDKSLSVKNVEEKMTSENSKENLPNMPKLRTLVNDAKAVRIFDENYYFRTTGEIINVSTGKSLLRINSNNEIKYLYYNKTKTKFVLCFESCAYFYYKKDNSLVKIDLPNGNLSSVQRGNKVIFYVENVKETFLFNISKASLECIKDIQVIFGKKGGKFNTLIVDNHRILFSSKKDFAVSKMFVDKFTQGEIFASTNNEENIITFYDKNFNELQEFKSDSDSLKWSNIYKNSVLYNGVIFYPLDRKIAAVNISTKNSKMFDCAICNPDCKLIRVPEGFYIIDTKKIILYEFFSI